jgi:ABC-2 type transport system ATP-binding protein
LQSEGVTILISSHILSDLEDICTQIALIGSGRNATDAEGNSVIQLRVPQAQVRVYEIEWIGEGTAPAAIAKSFPGARLLESAALRLTVEIADADEQAASLLHALVIGGVNVVRFDRRVLDLEERYRLAFGDKQP